MIDLYRRLNVSPESDAASLGAALSHADPATREAAQMILLNQRRRAVYDRNRQVLVTIGQLRARLGINYSRFWSRALYGDFVVELEADASAPPSRLLPGCGLSPTEQPPGVCVTVLVSDGKWPPPRQAESNPRSSRSPRV